jgi:hypothetical protein
VAFAAIGARASYPRLLAIAQWGGLFAGAWFAWVYLVSPRIAPETPGILIVAEALCDVLLVWFCCALVSFLIHLATSLADFGQIIRAALWAACDAVWFAPAILLLSTFSPGAIVLSLILVVNTTRLLVARSMRQDYLILADHAHRRRMLFIAPELASPFFSWKCAPALLGAFCAQAGLASLWKGYPFVGAVFFAACAATLTAYSIGSEVYHPSDESDARRSVWTLLATLILATALSTGSLQISSSLSAPGAIPGGPMGNTRVALDRALHQIPEPAAPAEDQAVAQPNVTPVFAPHAAEAVHAAPVAGAYSGVVLHEKEKPQRVAVLPMPVHNGVFGASMTHDVVIPFTGVYWLFRPPAPRPPADAIVREGTPIQSAFSTTDGTPIRMEAHQRLIPPVDIRCCDKIKVDFANGEGKPGVLYAGMVLLNTADGDSSPQSLAVLDTPLSTRTGTFEFSVPRPSTLRQFNEIEVFLYWNWMGNDRTPRVALERFVLVPR